jgi:hypothetical protein
MGTGHQLLVLRRLLLRRLQLAEAARHCDRKPLLVAALPALPLLRLVERAEQHARDASASVLFHRKSWRLAGDPGDSRLGPSADSHLPQNRFPMPVMRRLGVPAARGRTCLLKRTTLRCPLNVAVRPIAARRRDLRLGGDIVEKVRLPSDELEHPSCDGNTENFGLMR